MELQTIFPPLYKKSKEIIMFNWVENKWAQGACCICCVAVIIFSILATFRYGTGTPVAYIVFGIDILLAIIIAIGLHGWGNTVLGVILFLLNLIRMIFLIKTGGSFTDASLMLLLTSVSALTISVLSAFCS